MELAIQFFVYSAVQRGFRFWAAQKLSASEPPQLTTLLLAAILTPYMEYLDEIDRDKA
jgi:hypothetical protein